MQAGAMCFVTLFSFVLWIGEGTRQRSARGDGAKVCPQIVLGLFGWVVSVYLPKSATPHLNSVLYSSVFVKTLRYA